MNVISKFIENYTSFEGIEIIKQGSNAVVKKNGNVIFFRQLCFGMDSSNIANSARFVGFSEVTKSEKAFIKKKIRN